MTLMDLKTSVGIVAACSGSPFDQRQLNPDPGDEICILVSNQDHNRDHNRCNRAFERLCVPFCFENKLFEMPGMAFSPLTLIQDRAAIFSAVLHSAKCLMESTSLLYSHAVV